MYQSLRYRESFLGRYLVHCAELETAEPFDLWSALWVLSNLCRQTVIARPGAPVRLNLYVMLVAESGVARKSTAVNIAGKVLSACANDCLLIQARQSPESIAAAGNGHLAFHASEAVALLGRSSYGHALPAFLTDVYDCPAQYHWSTSELTAVYPTMLCATAPSWLRRSMSRDVVAGGFTSRLITVACAEGKGRKAWPTVVRTEGEFIAHAVSALRAPPKQITLTTEAIAYYSRWYETRELQDGEYLASFDSRMPDHILRTAGLLAYDRGSSEVDSTDLRSAQVLVSIARDHGHGVFGGLGSTGGRPERPQRDRLGAVVGRICDVLHQNGHAFADQTELTRRLSRTITSGGLINVLEAMHSLEMVHRLEEHGTGGRPKTLWRGTSNLLTVPRDRLLAEIDRSRVQ